MRRTMLIVLVTVLACAAGLTAGCAVAPSNGESPTRPAESQTPAPAAEEPDVTDGVFSLTSPAFADGAAIPRVHATSAAGGENVSPPLKWSDPPSSTVSFALECVDLYPAARNWVHWLVVGIPGDVNGLPERWSGASHGGARELANGFGSTGWGGPQPPVGTGAHEYRFTLYALSSGPPQLADGTSLAEFRAAVAPATLGTATLTGTYTR